MQIKFAPGHIVATPGAVELLERTETNPIIITEADRSVTTLLLPEEY